MMQSASPLRHDGSPSSQNALSVIAALAEQRTGQQIGPNRIWRIETALKPIMRAHRIDSLEELVVTLMTASDPKFTEEVVEAILNHETSFFRDATVLDQIADAILTMRAEAGARRLRIWSAGCSTGQEPYSLAILLSERLGIDDPLFPEIIATDISSRAVARAREARFSQFEIQRGMPIRRMISWFDNVDEEWVATPGLIQRVRFQKANLVSDQPPPGKFDLVLCRNVMLYFSQPLRRRVFDHLAGAMRDDGMLVLGAGETVIGQTDALTPSSRFRGFYRKTAGV